MLVPQTGNQVAVDLDDVQVVQPRQQRLGQRAETGADLDERENLLRGAYGPVAADPVTLGLSIGYRFR